MTFYQRRIAGLILFAGGMVLMGVGAANHISSSPPAAVTQPVTKYGNTAGK